MRTTTRIARMAVVALFVAGPLLTAPRAEQTRSPLEIGARPPKSEVQMKNVDGSMVSITGVAGEKGTLVIFSCNACPWVKAWEDRIASLGNAYREQGIGVIAINANDPSQSPEDGFDVMKQRAQERGFAFPYVVDSTSEVAAAFGATRTPEAFLFNSDRKLVYHGAIDDNAKEPDKIEEHFLRDALDAVLAGEPVPVAETKAIGCSIKFREKA